MLMLPLLWCSAQSPKQVEDGLFKINALTPGASYELGVSNTTTLNFDVLLGVEVRGGSERSTEFGIYPSLGAEFRKYVNMDRRLRKEKDISGNSGNYVSFTNQFQFGSPLIGNLNQSSDYYYLIGVVYGIQRMRPKGFYWGVSFGPSIIKDNLDVNAAVVLDLRLGWVLGQRKKN